MVTLEVKHGKIADKNAIQFYGGKNNNPKIEGEVPPAKPSISGHFSVVAEMYLSVPFEFLNDIISLLTAKGYVYKTKTMNNYTLFALQYQKVN